MVDWIGLDTEGREYVSRSQKMMKMRATGWMVTNLVLAALEAQPAAHNEEVVPTDSRDHIDTLGLELVVLCEEPWKMVGVAGGLDVD
jgi:hypothetical protein